MTNLERAAAIAAERGWPLVEVYRGWPVYDPVDNPYGAWVVCPHEMDAQQFGTLLVVTFPEIPDCENWSGFGLLTDIPRHDIDRLEAAREAMPATAFFGVEQEATL